ncbi:MAG: transposase [Gemmataceae bacterium]|nr:transposase [Gemmataceae bacterium]
MLAKAEPAWQAARAKGRKRRERLRAPGAGPKHALGVADIQLMLLTYYRTHVPHVFLAFLSKIDDSTVSRELLFDGVERPVNRPKRGQGRPYSGKKKRHTLKDQVVVVRKRKKAGRRRKDAPAQKRRQRIAAVQRASPGKEHDKKVYDRSRTLVPPDARKTGDTGCQGKDMETPAKKPRGGELTDRQKRGNARISRRRIAVEHGIGKRRIRRVAGERWRNPLRRHTLVIKNVAGLHNLVFG